MNMNLLPEGVLASDLPPVSPGVELEGTALAAQIVIGAARAEGRRRDGNGPDRGYFPEGSPLRTLHEEHPFLSVISRQLAFTSGLVDAQNAIPTIAYMKRQGAVIGRIADTGKDFKTVITGSRAAANKRGDSVFSRHSRVPATMFQDAGSRTEAMSFDPFDQERSLWTVAVLAEADVTVFEDVKHPLSTGERDDLWQDYLRFGALFGLSSEHAPTDYQGLQEYIDGRFRNGELHLIDAAKPIGKQVSLEVTVPPWMSRSSRYGGKAIIGMMREEVRDMYDLPYDERDARIYRRAKRFIAGVDLVSGLFIRNIDSQLFQVAKRTERQLRDQGRLPPIPDPLAELA